MRNQRHTSKAVHHWSGDKMSQVVPNAGLLNLANDLYVYQTPSPSFLLDLYSNDYAPDSGSTFSDFQICDFPGYATVTIARTSLQPAVIEAGYAKVAYSSNPVQWANYGNVETQVWGYVIRDSGTGTVLFAEQFAEIWILAVNQILDLNLYFRLFPNVVYSPPPPPPGV